MKAENLAGHRSKVHPKMEFRAQTIRPARKPRSERPLSRRSLRAVGLLLAVLLVAAGAAWLLSREAEQARPLDSSAMRMTISMAGFSPGSLSMRTGTELRINLINLDNPFHSDGGGRHNFVSPELGINVLVEPEGQRVFTVRAGSPGTYMWYCDTCCGGKDNPLMVGTVTVTD